MILWFRILWFEAILPDGFDTIAEIIDDAASLNATTGREEATEELQSDLQTIAALEYPAVQ